VGIVKEQRPNGAGNGRRMTGKARLLRMASMKKIFVSGVVLAMLALAGVAFGQKDKGEEPTAWVYFLVVKDDNGKPVRNAAVIMHPVSAQGKQSRGGMELKTDNEGKANFDGVPLGPLRVQVLAHGFQTFGEDYDVAKSKMDITIKLKRPQGQFSVYDDRPKDEAAPPKQDPPPSDQDKKPN
jgi:Carboxypeptidase regulatory-like domain